VDIKEYIESGILEAYALGFASEGEIRDVEENLLRYPELQLELEKIQNALESNAVVHAKVPPAGVKESIHAKLFSGSDVKILKLPGKRPKLTTIAAAVALIALAANIWLYYQFRSVKLQLAELEAEKIEYVNNIDKLQVKYKASEDQLAFISGHGVKSIEMKPVANKVPHSATVFWNSDNGKLMVNVKDLPAAPAGHQYQLWAIVEGQPVDLGLYNPESTFQQMKQVSTPQAFAVTLEKTGGSPVPTMDQMVVMGGV
jgi:hypothetical protein